MDNDNINFSSKDIKKKDLDFTVKEKKSTEINKSVKGFWGKIAAGWKKFLTSPLMKGWHKFITLGVALVIIAAAIILPIYFTKLNGSEEQDQSAQMTEEERKEWVLETSNIVNNLDSDADEDTRSATLRLLDEQIAAASTDEDKLFLIGAKANALNRFGQHLDAVTILLSVTEDLESRGDWPKLVDIYGYISSSYTQAGDKQSALEYLEKVLEVYDKAAADPKFPLPMADRDFWESMVETMKGEL